MVKLCIDKYPINSEYECYFQEYKFPLSDFQKYAIEAIVKEQHVLVTAHTGSGKTLPAEFAINHLVKQNKKVIYTSPIKALSNQKYSEFRRKYPHISFGLMTGDIKINPDADVLIMTTEILMNSLFIQGSENVSDLEFNININNELACVVFDEVHYINDQDRGQTWEKTILMLPKHIQMVMLSATIDSPERFAKWAERDDPTKEVYLASTHKRVVPLTHYGYLTNTESSIKLLKDKALEKDVRNNIHKLIKIQDEHGKFNNDGYKSLARLTKMFNQKSMYVKRKHVLNNLSSFLHENNMLPAIAFVFSRKMVEQCASEITVPLLEDDSKIPYNVANECEQIVRKLPNFKEYLELPEYNTLVKLLEKGIGIHHSGMIPILREIVEIMISKNYIKLLFATESFAIGLDCPIKTAIFSSTTKFDGRSHRTLLSHEYTQMAGRAGRRGIDKVGHVVHCNNLFDLPLQNDYELMLNGNPQSLISKFRISYGLVFNLIKNGKFTIGEFSDFIHHSMISNELRDEMKHQNNVIQEITNKQQSFDENTSSLKTNPIVCKRYNEICNTIQNSKNKQRKQLEKEKSRILQENPNCKNDAKLYNDFEELTSQIHQETEQLYFLEHFVEDKLESLCEVLIQEEFLTKTENNYTFCEKGEISSNIAEIHPLIISNMLLHNNWFSSMNVNEIAAILSLFTDVNVAKEEKTSFPQSENKEILNTMVYLQEQFEYYDTIEQNSHIRSGLEYDDVLCFDMPELVEKWCYCDDEQQCKYFLQNDAAHKGISPGDFTKALLKISNIVRELSVCAEKMNQIECLHKLSQVDGKLLKYITTSQSLYI
jgi:superfamily II RNA helicase